MRLKPLVPWLWLFPAGAILIPFFAMPLCIVLRDSLYRDDPVPLALHLGQLVTITVLGGAGFGLPTTLVSERERGVWRRYRLTPAPRWLFIAAIHSAGASFV